jgi:hypothetical protein
MKKGQASTAIAIIVVVIFIIAALIAWLLLPGSLIMTSPTGGQPPTGGTGPTIGNIPTTQGNTWCNSGEMDVLDTGGITSYAYIESNMEMFQGMYLCKGDINAMGGQEKYVFTNEDKTIWFVTTANGAILDSYIGGGNTGGSTTPPSIPTPPSGGNTGAAITKDSIMSGNGLVCDFHYKENDGSTWDFTYKSEYPKLNIQHTQTWNGTTGRWENRGDVTAVINDSVSGDMRLTDMYIIIKESGSPLNISLNTWYYDRYWHDFGDFDVGAPVEIVWIYNQTQKSNSPDYTLDCRWEDVPDSEFYLPSGVTPQESPMW